MDKTRAVLYCHADSALSTETAEQELRRQQELLERYADTHGMELTASYLHVGLASLDLDDPVLRHMLQDAKGQDLDIILVERFELFPECAPENIPPICLHSAEENRRIVIGESFSPLFDAVTELPSGGAVYFRDGSDVAFSNSPNFY